ncbi:MAG: ubiquinol-cytochrome c reductase iron-sulfur subunit [Planctomycetota bacterium]
MDRPLGRRTLLGRAARGALTVGTVALAGATGVWAAAVGRFMMPAVVAGPSQRFRVGKPEDFAPGEVDTRFRDQHGVWIVRFRYRGQDRIVAYRAECTHLGCITQWNPAEGKFRCPCHGSAFGIDGLNLEGPAPRPLERCAIRLTAGGQLEIERSRVFRGELGQWEDPDSYVGVA